MDLGRGMEGDEGLRVGLGGNEGLRVRLGRDEKVGYSWDTK